MIVLIIGAALAVLAAVFFAAFIKKKSSTGKTSVVLIALALLFALAFCVVPFSIHIVETGQIAVVKHLGEAKNVRTPGTYFDFCLTEIYVFSYRLIIPNVLEICTSAPLGESVSGN